jgi:hypothetical protein
MIKSAFVIQSGVKPRTRDIGAQNSDKRNAVGICPQSAAVRDAAGLIPNAKSPSEMGDSPRGWSEAQKECKWLKAMHNRKMPTCE